MLIDELLEVCTESLHHPGSINQVIALGLWFKKHLNSDPGGGNVFIFYSVDPQYLSSVATICTSTTLLYLDLQTPWG